MLFQKSKTKFEKIWTYGQNPYPPTRSDLPKVSGTPEYALKRELIPSGRSIAQSSSNFEKRNFNYNEWTKGKFSEVVTVTNPGKFIFLAGIGPEREGDGKIVHEGNFIEQCRYAYMKIKKLLDAQGATMNDVVRIMTFAFSRTH